SCLVRSCWFVSLFCLFSCLYGFFLLFFFFFQAEDGIRDFHVTGVQTCALPISRPGDDRTRRPSRRTDGRRVRSSPGREASPRSSSPCSLPSRSRCPMPIPFSIPFSITFPTMPSHVLPRRPNRGFCDQDVCGLRDVRANRTLSGRLSGPKHRPGGLPARRAGG